MSSLLKLRWRASSAVGVAIVVAPGATTRVATTRCPTNSRDVFLASAEPIRFGRIPTMIRSLCLAIVNCLAVIILISFAAYGQQQLPGWVNAQLPWQKAVVDANGRLLAWYHPEKTQGYDKVLRLVWDFMEHKVPNDPATGLKVYLLNAVYDDKALQGWNWQGNPASLYGQFV